MARMNNASEGVEESIVRASGGGRSPAAFQPTETMLEHCGAEGGAAQGCGPLPRAREGFLNTLSAQGRLGAPQAGWLVAATSILYVVTTAGCGGSSPSEVYGPECEPSGSPEELPAVDPIPGLGISFAEATAAVPEMDEITATAVRDSREVPGAISVTLADLVRVDHLVPRFAEVTCGSAPLVTSDVWVRFEVDGEFDESFEAEASLAIPPETVDAGPGLRVHAIVDRDDLSNLVADLAGPGETWVGIQFSADLVDGESAGGVRYLLENAEAAIAAGEWFW